MDGGQKDKDEESKHNSYHRICETSLLLREGFKPCYHAEDIVQSGTSLPRNSVWENLDKNLCVCIMQKTTVVQHVLDKDLQNTLFQRLIETETFIQLSSKTVNLR